ncbi:MAG: tyrosine-type recombinase/integrase [Actinomycetota bacterium]|nr:tyrosine-type recombinase/integrase [Actinomycetota bacterium]
MPKGTPNQRDVAEQILQDFNRQIEENRFPRTDASLTTLLEHHLGEWWTGTAERAKSLMSYVRNHVAPVIGDKHRARDVDAELLEWFYEDLARCRKHCTTRGGVDHYTTEEHSCTARCVKHECLGLASTTIRHIHFLISAAYRAGMKKSRGWVVSNPAEDAAPPASPAYTPQPPTREEMATILNQAFLDDPDWGVLLWYEVTSGCRRGEVCGLRDDDILERDDDPDRDTAAIERAIKKATSSWYVGLPKTGKPRRVVLDPVTTMLIRNHRAWRRERAALKGIDLPHDAYTFSTRLDGSQYRTPGSITQRFTRLVKKLGINTTVHKLRHYSATELILAGVDIRTVAGRLGHGGGGATTLKVYAAFVEEADQRAAGVISARMPEQPQILTPAERALADPRAPYEKMAAKLREQLLVGRYSDGDEAPPLKKLAAAFGVAEGTAHRAMDLLRAWGLVTGGGRGHPNIWAVPTESLDTQHGTESPLQHSAEPSPAPNDDGQQTEVVDIVSGEPLDIEVIHLGQSAHRFSTVADPDDTFQMLTLLGDAVRRAGGEPSEIGDYEMVVRYSGERGVVRTFVAPPSMRDHDAPNRHAQGRAALVAVS